MHRPRAPLALALALVALVLAPTGPAAAAARPASPDGASARRTTVAGCPADLADELGSTRGARELVTVEAPTYRSTTATLETWLRRGRCFVRAAGPFLADVGESGLSDHHVEGDGTTPTGAYGIGPTMYGVEPDPGVAYRYHRLACGDWWDEDPSSPGYNTFEHVPCGERPPFGGVSEALWTEAPAYDHFAVIDYNTDPVVPGAGSGIFLHVATGQPTVGCVAIAAAALDAILRWLRPGDHPLVVVGTVAEIRRF